MTIDEAIKHCEEVAEREQQKGYYANTEANQSTEYGTKCFECAKEHRQIAEWLRELKEYRKFYSCYNCYNASASFNEYPCNVCRRGLEATKNIKDHYKEVNADD